RGGVHQCGVGIRRAVTGMGWLRAAGRADYRSLWAPKPPAITGTTTTCTCRATRQTRRRPMSRWLHAAAAAYVLLMLSGCGTPAQPADECMAELERVPAVESIAVDVELLVDDIVNRLGAESYWSGVNALSTACPAPGNFPDQSRRDGVSYEDVKAVDLVRVGALSGIVFLYHSRGEEEILTGVAAALVEYQEDGTPGHAYKLSELLGGEGWARLTKSTVTRAGIRRCTQ